MNRYGAGTAIVLPGRNVPPPTGKRPPPFILWPPLPSASCRPAGCLLPWVSLARSAGKREVCAVLCSGCAALSYPVCVSQCVPLVCVFSFSACSLSSGAAPALPCRAVQCCADLFQSLFFTGLFGLSSFFLLLLLHVLLCMFYV